MESQIIPGRPPKSGYSVDIASGFGIGAYDYVSLAQTSTVDTWTFKSGGSSGTTVGTIAITYTDSGKGTISHVTKT